MWSPRTRSYGFERTRSQGAVRWRGRAPTRRPQTDVAPCTSRETTIDGKQVWKLKPVFHAASRSARATDMGQPGGDRGASSARSRQPTRSSPRRSTDPAAQGRGLTGWKVEPGRREHGDGTALYVPFGCWRASAGRVLCAPASCSASFWFSSTAVRATGPQFNRARRPSGLRACHRVAWPLPRGAGYRRSR
jgi:hypothetical protein